MIGIYGGSFDPVHLGHLKTATSLKTELHLDHLFLLPCCEPVHKDGLKYSSNDRLKMLNLAVIDYCKAMLAEQNGEIDKKEYFMKEFFSKLGDNESNKRNISVSFPTGPFAIR